MYDLIKINEHDYYIDCPAKIGIVKTNDTDVVLIDSGNDKNAGKRILRVIQENGWNLTAIYNTHSHADHIGGNRYLQEKTGCKCYAYGIEQSFANTPSIEPTLIFGARPIKELNNKFLLAEESLVLPLTPDVLPSGMKIINLPGHTSDMIGFLTADKTAYIADLISSKPTLSKYGVCYIWNYLENLESIEKAKTIDADMFVPSHAEASSDITDLLEYNQNSILKTKELILDICKEPISFDMLLKRVFDYFSLSMTAQQFALVGSTVRSYLSVMYEQGLVDIKYTENLMLWVTL